MFVSSKNITKINLNEANHEIEKIDQIYLLRFEKLLVEYLKNYNHTSTFEDISFKMICEDNQIICPLTIEKKSINENILNFYDQPFEFFFKGKIGKKVETKLLIYLSEIITKNDITKINMKVKQDLNNNIDFEKNKSYSNLVSVYKERFVNIKNENKQIMKGFSAGLRNELKKNYEGTEYIIINKDNYKKNEILKMMYLHEKISKKKTRTKESWIINEKMILENKAFLIKCLLNGECISYNLFFHNSLVTTWFSSCSIREHFKNVRNLSSTVVWMAMKYVKDSHNCSYFNLGAETIFSREPLSDKEKNIEFFKGKFRGTGETYFLYDLLPTKLFCM